MRRTLLRAFAILMLMASTAWAQTQITTGAIQGTVVDAQGGIVPGADLVAKNVDTNQNRTLTPRQVQLAVKLNF